MFSKTQRKDSLDYETGSGLSGFYN